MQATDIAQLNSSYTKRQIRIAVSVFFFCQGICFASWASRIPDIKTTLQLSEAALGSILLALPAGQLTMMPFSGKLVTRFGSKYVLRLAAIGYALTLILIGSTTAAWQLAAALYLFGLSGNLCNISVNTQAVNAESLFGRSILASFHGVWSTAGFTGALVGLLMMRFNLQPVYHFMLVAGTVITLNLFFQKKLIITPVSKTASSFKRFQFPKGLLLQLGLIAFCCLSAEGCMFDWSGVYFKEVVEVKGELVSLGYASFMVMMATGRFTGDRLAERFGRKRMVQLSGVLIFTGMMIAVLLPNIIFATIGFMIVGFGVSSIIPLVYSTAGKVKEVASGIAIATVSGVGFFGFLMGPPLIGYIAELAGLRSSFAVIAVLGLVISYMISKIKLA
ncbi:fucose permease [Lacibacter cauensis]|uniref:Fucose permease n=1 Tax=Lacibacter cauensis TaxID=510947 RepID=A0A562SWC0_9BACT|nr:MFS transporter [Lacibacter cauensis]TWI85597.1 fucose permease [Lacibacter cauensis]